MSISKKNEFTRVRAANVDHASQIHDMINLKGRKAYETVNRCAML